MGTLGDKRSDTTIAPKSPWWHPLLTTVIPSAVIPVALASVINFYFSSARWANEPFHSLIEGSGSFAAILMALFIIIMRQSELLRPSYIWVATTLMGMGLLDGFHASVEPGPAFIWLHSLATFLGGSIFALVILPEHISRRAGLQSLPYLIAAISTFLGAVSILFPELLPAMATNGRFTLFAELLNILGGIGFVIAWFHFSWQQKETQPHERLLLANHCLLFGMAGMLFHFSVLWDATWWLWHLLRLFAYLVLLWFFIDIYHRDVKRLRSNQITLQQRGAELERAQQIIENTSEAIILTDANGMILDVNNAYTRITGFEQEEVIGRNPNISQSGYHDQAFYADMWKQLNESGHWAGEIWDRRKNGEIFPKWLTINALKREGEDPFYYVGIFSDITEKKNTEKELTNLAFYDPLTQLPNRVLFLERLEEALAISQRHHDRVALLFIDLDRFKDVNDTLGHNAGDVLIVEAAKRIKRCLRKTDTVARLGGDEFTIILTEISSEASIAYIAQQLIDEINRPYNIYDNEVFVGASIGIAVYPDDSKDSETLIKNADTAMYHAKDSGRGVFKFFRTEMNERTLRRVTMERNLRYALENGDFLLHYQPRYLLDSGRMVGMEALVRWDHHEEGMISPGEFIPLAEETNLIFPLGEWVLKSACLQAKAWQREGLGPYRLAVNLSPRQFQQHDLLNLIRTTLQEADLEPDLLELEITESVLMDDPEGAVELLGAIRELGVHISIDDFGTGYSSLAYLKKFPINALKIDQSFVRDLPDDQDDVAIVDSIIALAESLGLDVVAEGVETLEQANFLQSRGCNEVQGYYFSRPLPAEVLRETMQALKDGQ